MREERSKLFLLLLFSLSRRVRLQVFLSHDTDKNYVVFFSVFSPLDPQSADIEHWFFFGSELIFSIRPKKKNP